MKKGHRDIFYSPPGLAEAISAALGKPLTLITAGAGFGKTTAVTHFLDRLPEEVSRHWYTCFGEPPERTWAGICRLIAHADRKTAGHLSKLDISDPEAPGYVAQLMEGLSCETETLLVMDNYQLSGFPRPYRLLDALSLHRCPRIHFIVITQPIRSGIQHGCSASDIYRIHQEKLCFRPKEIEKLFASGGVVLTEEEAEGLFLESEGWIAALRLHLADRLFSGTLSGGAGMNELMERVFWQPLEEGQREFLLMLSVLDTFTEKQAAVLLGRSQAPEQLWRLVQTHAFIRQAGPRYTMHSLLKDYLAEKLTSWGPEFLKALWSRAGAACRLEGKNPEAVDFFLRAGDYTATFETPLSDLEMAELVQREPERVASWLLRVPGEALQKDPRRLLAFGIKAALQGKPELIKAAAGQLQSILALPGAGSDCLRYTSASLELLASFRAYNDVAEMCRHHRAALDYLGGGEVLYRTANPWTSCAPSVVFMFWRETGGLGETCRLLTEGIPTYSALSGGGGSGAAEAMEAERFLLSGELSQAEVLAHRALYLADSHGQDSICFCAQLILGRIALLRGDAKGFVRITGELRRRAFEGVEFRCVTTSEICLGFLWALLDRDEQIPGWLGELNQLRRHLYVVAAPFAQCIYLHLLQKRDGYKCLALAEEFAREAEGLHLMLPQIYCLLARAAVYEGEGLRDKARESLGRALAKALPDGVYLPFGEYYETLSGVLEDPALPWDDPGKLEKVRTLGRQFFAGAAAVRGAITGTSPLTPREREVALLARDRLSTQEIARRLAIAPATVKNTLNKVYSKLDIRRKSELSDTLL